MALEIYSLFIPSTEISRDELLELITKSYSSFSHPKVAPLKYLNHTLWVLELWHGPTFAFKDVALQFLGNLFEFFLSRKNQQKKTQNDGPTSHPERITVVGATSGDTGSAAIYGLRGKKDISIFILHPRGRVSPIQEAQMTTVLDENVFNFSVAGTFDDCQDIVKSLFNDTEFNSEFHLGAVNSINWARILAQIVYYFSSYLEIKSCLAADQKVQYVVPTGNFGDILAGYYAYRLGLPMGINQRNPGLVIATNSNDILTRFWESGKYEKLNSSLDGDKKDSENIQTGPVGGSSDGQQQSTASKQEDGFVKATLSPAMDILVSSNFERLLFHLAFDTLTQPEESTKSRIENSQAQVNHWMQELKSTGKFQVTDPSFLETARRVFGAGRVNDQETAHTIRAYFNGHGSDLIESGESYLVDPHTAVGLCVASRHRETNDPRIVQIVLSTAHPAKFSEAVINSVGSEAELDFERKVLPEAFKGLLEKPRRVLKVDSIELEVTKKLIAEQVMNLFGGGPIENTSSQNTASV